MGDLNVTLHHDGVFVPNPLKYACGSVKILNEIRFEEMQIGNLFEIINRLVLSNANHIYYCLPDTTLTRGIRELKTDSDMAEFMRIGYENNKQMELFTEHHGYDVLEYTANDNLVANNISDYEESDVSDYDGESDPENVDFHTEGEQGVHFERLSIDDPFLTKLVGNGNFIGARSDPMPFLIGNYNVEEDDPEVDIIDPIYKVVKGKSYPVYDPEECWKENKRFSPYVCFGVRIAKDKENGKGKLGEKDKENGKGKMVKSKEIIKWTKIKVLEQKGHACPFRLWASWMQNERSFQIKTLYSDHKCARDYNLGSLVTFRWIAKHYAKEIILNPSIPIRSMHNDIREKFLINVSMGQCKRAKQFALYEHEGGLIEHYSKLWEYRNAVIESNPGSTCHIDQVVDDDGQIHFSRLYVCYKGLKDGWIAGCRRVIGIDGCFLTHHCKGELLSAIGRDANNQMFPIAWAVVRVENKNNWCWFLSLLSDDLGLQDGLGITVISDAHKGLEEAVKTWLPQAEHRHCTRHLYANFKKKWSGVHYKRMFWAAASSTVEQEFLSKMEDIRRFDPEAHAYLMKREPASWCKAFFQPAVKCVAFENGISESFNGKIVTARGKPIITMLEDIRVYVMQRHWTISKKASELEDTICPSIRKKIEILKKKMRSWQVCPSGYQVLEVRKRDEAYGVNLIERSCFCKLWDLSGIPCMHVVAVYMHLHMDLKLDVEVYSKHTSTAAYHIKDAWKAGHNKQTCTAKKQPKPQKSGKPPKPPSYKKISKHVKGGGSVVRGGGSNIGRGLVREIVGREAAREVFAEVNAAREQEMLEIERNGRVYQDWDDVQCNDD
ncbi:hypothetical protein Tco_0133118 [Tanacetum coccineum]